jgi:multimeric flavodoxin WrbA
MKILILNGNNSPNNSEFNNYLNSLSDKLISDNQKVNYFTLKDLNIKNCLGCWDCFIKTPGGCPIKDDFTEIYKLYVNSDFVLFASPITMGFITSTLKRVMDRFTLLNKIPDLRFDNDEFHNKPRYQKRPKWGLILEQSQNSDIEDVEIISSTFPRMAMNSNAKFCFTKLSSDNQIDILYAINNN